MSRFSDAVSMARRGDAHGAARLCELLLKNAPADAEALSLLAEIRSSLNEPSGARQCLAQLVQLRPMDASTWRRLGTAELGCGRFDQAAQALRRAIELEPSSVRAHNNLGQALLRGGKIREAIASFEIALKLEPRYAIGRYNLGLALLENAEPDRAIAALRQALALDPALLAAHLSLITILAQRRQWADALQSCDEALRTAPADASLLTKKASVLLSLERPADALKVADLILREREENAEAHNLRSGALRRLARHADALRSLDRAIAIDPGYVEAWRNRGMVLHELGEFPASIESYRHAVQLDPDDLQTRARLLSRLIPSVPLSEQEAADARKAYEAELRSFEEWLAGHEPGMADALTVAEQQFFYLTYQEQSNKALLSRYRRAGAMRLAALEPPPPPLYGNTGAGRLRLGFISAHVHDHSVYQAILRGWLQHLDRTRFEVALFSLGPRQDAMTREAACSVERYETGARYVGDWARLIRDARCEALVYPELGMNSQCLALAALRLAPHQLAAWGHPETSGLPTIDGFLSAEAYEPANANMHYSEQLWRLPRLGVHCRPYGLAPEAVDLERLGLSGHGPLLICPGVPAKYRPADDAVLVEIARSLGRCRFVFFQYEVPELSGKLLMRIRAAFRDAGLAAERYLALIPWQPRPAFFALMRAADVYLDTLGFSGFNTFMQAVECNLPCVAYEGEFMRGRLGSGILRRLGLDELVAINKQAYAAIAVKLASSDSYRVMIRGKMREAERLVFGDVAAVNALADILTDERNAS